MAAALAACRPEGGDPLDRLSNAEIVENFLKIATTSEFQPSGPVTSRIKKWDQPVRLAVTGTVDPEFLRLVREHVGELRMLTGHDIALAEPPWLQPFAGEEPPALRQRLAAAGINFVVFYWDGDWADFSRANEQLLLAFRRDRRSLEQSQRFHETNNSLCAAFAVNLQGSITRAYAVIRPTLGDARLRSCIAEELTQAMGLTNDVPEVEYSMFNDLLRYKTLTGQDRLFLRVLYDRRLRPGMTPAEARRAAREVMRELRPGK